MKTKKVKISSLKPHPKNPNTHPKGQIAELKDSLNQFDQVKNIVVWQGWVIAGNGLLMAAKKQGRKEIEIQDVSGWPEEKAIAFMISDNRLAELAIKDDDILADLLKGFDEPLDIPGIDENLLDELDINPSLDIDKKKYREEINEIYGIYIECDNEEKQLELLEYLNKKGIKCKPLIS